MLKVGKCRSGMDTYTAFTGLTTWFFSADTITDYEMLLPLLLLLLPSGGGRGADGGTKGVGGGF
jgi:hypothetical protein